MELNRGLIEPIFAIPMYRNILSKGLTKEQISFIEKNKKDILKNESNAFTKNVAILEDKIFKDLKKELLLMLKEYLWIHRAVENLYEIYYKRVMEITNLF